MKTYIFRVIGKVQGVYYRANTQKNASQLGYQGSVKNLKNGDVEVIATLKDDRLEDFVSLLKKGSPNSKVSNIDYIEVKNINFDSFSILY
jgi:acylphosphatase